MPPPCPWRRTDRAGVRRETTAAPVYNPKARARSRSFSVIRTILPNNSRPQRGEGDAFLAPPSHPGDVLPLDITVSAPLSECIVKAVSLHIKFNVEKFVSIFLLRPLEVTAIWPHPASNLVLFFTMSRPRQARRQGSSRRPRRPQGHARRAPFATDLPSPPFGFLAAVSYNLKKPDRAVLCPRPFPCPPAGGAPGASP